MSVLVQARMETEETFSDVTVEQKTRLYYVIVTHESGWEQGHHYSWGLLDSVSVRHIPHLAVRSLHY